jgi:hypothetical protein
MFTKKMKNVSHFTKCDTFLNDVDAKYIENKEYIKNIIYNSN